MSAFCDGPRWRLSIKHSTPCIFGSLKPEQFPTHIGQKHLKITQIKKKKFNRKINRNGSWTLEYYLRHRCKLIGIGLKQPTHGNNVDIFSSSSMHHFGPITNGDSTNRTLFAGISLVAIKNLPNSLDCSILNGRQMCLCLGQCFF